MKYKMVVSDFDGTLYTSDYKITDKTKETISKFVTGGGKMFIATGRLFQAIKPHAEYLNLDNEVVTYQGSGIFDLKTKQQIYSKHIDSSLAQEIYATMEKKYPTTAIPILFYEDRCIVESPSGHIEKFSEIIMVPVDYAGMPLSDYVKINDIKPTKILALVPSELARKIIGQLKESYGALFNINQSSSNLVEMVNIEASKGNAVAWLAEKYGIDREEIICIGDAENDNSMLEYAGLGVAMANAMEVTKQVADYITDSNDNDGVAKVIEKFCLCD